MGSVDLEDVNIQLRLIYCSSEYALCVNLYVQIHGLSNFKVCVVSHSLVVKTCSPAAPHHQHPPSRHLLLPPRSTTAADISNHSQLLDTHTDQSDSRRCGFPESMPTCTDWIVVSNRTTRCQRCRRPI